MVINSSYEALMPWMLLFNIPELVALICIPASSSYVEIQIGK
jgi:hypothetical protein